VEPEVKPEPDDDEREAILAALARDEDAGDRAESPWRRAALEEAIEDWPP
jgi:hypothetical protein